MRLLPTTLGALTVLLGAILALQSLGVIPGHSAVNGDHEWAFYGGCLALGGLVLMGWVRRGGQRGHR